MAFGYYSPVTVNAAQVPSAQTNFPMLVSYTDARLKTVGNGGHVQNANGYDIRPYNAVGGSAMTFELERYNASTGEVIMWVLVPSCDVGSIVYLYYGDATISTNGSSTSTWNSNFKGVWHLPDGTTLTVLDSTSNANNGTNNGATAATGKVDGGAAFVPASSQFIDTVDIASLDNAGAISVFAWVKETTLAINEAIVVKWDYQTQGNFGFQTGAFVAGYLSVFIATSLTDTGAGCRVDTAAAVLTANTWHHVGFVFDGSQTGNANRLKIYVDGQSVGVTQGIGNVPATTVSGSTATVKIGKFGGILTRYFNGSMDEVNVLNAALSADWVLTQYNNQSSPSTFFTLGGETAINQTNFFRMFN